MAKTVKKDPVEALRDKIVELRALSQENNIDMSEAIAKLKEELETALRKKARALTAWQHVKLARDPRRPYMLDYIGLLFTDFVELAGDRRFSDDKAIVGGFAKFRGENVMVIGTQKGRDTRSNLIRNFGWPGADGYRKALRLMKLADKAGVPIITFIDTPGAYPGIASEERHVGEAIAVNLREMFALRVPVIAIVIGEGGSGGALGLGVGNRILMMENAYYSVITPEGCAAILWKDRKFAPQAADALHLTSDCLLELGVADEVILEPAGGAQCDYELAAAAVGEAIERNLKSLHKMFIAKLIDQRYEKFRKIGVFTECAEKVAEDAGKGKSDAE
ncbi:MAG: acetyl-CoA carboxylase carboxyltransferase subunit alpha [Victivallaceae bacterium]|nr:acetyl-CoA carboxylase carboxyltransferase subunit alpha [Victivallaceae bacterium]